jgi:hypothetical protein
MSREDYEALARRYQAMADDARSAAEISDTRVEPDTTLTETKTSDKTGRSDKSSATDKIELGGLCSDKTAIRTAALIESHQNGRS